MSSSNESIEVDVIEKKKYIYSTEKKKEYYLNSKSKHLEPIKCVCGRYYTYFNHYNHRLTKGHLDYLNEKIGNLKDI